MKKFEVIEGGLSGKDGIFKDLNRQYAEVKKALKEYCDIHYVRDAVFIKPTIQDNGTGRDLLKNQTLFKKYYSDKYNPNIDLIRPIRPSHEVVLEVFLWDMEEKLEPQEKELVFGVFSMEISQCFFANNYTINPPLEEANPMRQNLIFTIDEVVSKGLNSLYRGDHEVYILQHDFFHDLYENKGSERPHFFRNAWFMWYNNIISYAFNEAMIQKALHLDHLAAFALKKKSIDEARMHIEGIRHITNTAMEQKRDDICRGIFDRWGVDYKTNESD